MSRPRFSALQQLRLFHHAINYRLSLDEIAARHNRPTSEIEYGLEHLGLSDLYQKRLQEKEQRNEERGA